MAWSPASIDREIPVCRGEFEHMSATCPITKSRPDQDGSITTCMTADTRDCGKWPAKQRDMGDLRELLVLFGHQVVNSSIPYGRGCAGSYTLAPRSDPHFGDQNFWRLETSLPSWARRYVSILQDWNQQLVNTKTKGRNRTLFHHEWTSCQSRYTKMISLPLLWNSFVGTGIHNRPVPLQVKSLYSWPTDCPHTHKHTRKDLWCELTVWYDVLWYLLRHDICWGLVLFWIPKFCSESG